MIRLNYFKIMTVLLLALLAALTYIEITGGI